MNRKKKIDKPALSFADSSVQGRSADVEDDNDFIEEDPQPSRRTTQTRNVNASEWMRGDGDNAQAIEEDLPNVPQRRRTTRKRNALPNWFEAGNSDQADDASSEERFVALSRGVKKGTRSRGKKRELEDEDIEFIVGDDEVEYEDEDDDFEPSTSRVGKKPNANHRKHLQMKREQERLKREREQQEEEQRQALAEEAEFLRVLEMSRLDAVEDAKRKKEEEEFLASINYKGDLLNDNRQGSNVTSNSGNHDNRGGFIAGSSQSSQEKTYNPSARCPNPLLQEMELPEQSIGSNHSEELIDLEEESTLVTGGGVRTSRSPSMFLTPDVEEVNNHQGMSSEVPSSTSGVSPLATRRRVQETLDQSLIRSTRLGLRRHKRPLEDIQSSSSHPRKRAVVVPTPPDPSTLDDLNVIAQDERRVVASRPNSQHSQHSGGANDDNDEVDYFEAMNAEVIEEGEPLVDRRNPPERTALFAPRGKSIKHYTKVIFKLLRHYCIQLRKSQARSPLQMQWGSPVVPGQCFSGTLRQRKRGVKAPVPVISLSDDESNLKDESAPKNNNSNWDGWLEAKSLTRPSIRQKRKRPNALDSDSSLEDIDIGNTSKKRTSKKEENVDVDVFDFDNDDDKRVPLLKVECVATICSSDKIRDSRDIPGPSSRDVPGPSSRTDDNVGRILRSGRVKNGSGNMDEGISSDPNEVGDLSQTLPYDVVDDEYNANTEEFIQEDVKEIHQNHVENKVSSHGPAEDGAAHEESIGNEESVRNEDTARKKERNEDVNQNEGISRNMNRPEIRERNVEDIDRNEDLDRNEETSRNEDNNRSENTNRNEDHDVNTNKADDTKAPSTSEASAVPSRHRRPSSSQEVCIPDERKPRDSNTAEDPCLVDSTTLAVLRKTRQSKRKLGSQSSSQSSQNGPQGPVSSSDAQGHVSGADQTSNVRAEPELSNSTAVDTRSNAAKSKSIGTDETASTSDNPSNMERSREESEIVETSSESRTKLSTKSRDESEVVETSSESRTKLSRKSPVDNVSSMPKTADDGSSKLTASSEAAGVTSSKEATQNKCARPNCHTMYGERGHKLSFEEARADFYANGKQGGAENEEATISDTSNSRTVENVENMIPSDIDDLVQETCSDALAASKSGVSSSLSENVKAADPERITKKRGSGDVASTSDRTEGEAEELPQDEAEETPREMKRIQQRNTRHPSPGVASSSDDQSVRRTTRNPRQEIDTASSADDGDVPASAGGGNVPVKESRTGMNEAVESSGLDSDASGVVVKRPGSEKAGERTLGIGSSDEAAVSEENAETRQNHAKRDATIFEDEASTSADFQSNDGEVKSQINEKEREAEPAKRHTNSTGQPSTGPPTVNELRRKPLRVTEKENATSSKERTVTEHESALNVKEREAQGVCMPTTRGRRIQNATMQGETDVRGQRTIPTMEGETDARESRTRPGRRIPPVPTMKRETDARESKAPPSRRKPPVPTLEGETDARQSRTPPVSAANTDVREIGIPLVPTMKGETTVRRRGAPPVESIDSQAAEEQVGADAGASQENQVNEEPVDKVDQIECPLCSTQFPLQEIEAHAAECDGTPPVKLPPRQTRQQVNAKPPPVNDVQDGGETSGPSGNVDGNVEIDLTDEDLPNSSWNAVLESRNNSRKRPLRTYGRQPKPPATNTNYDDEWPSIDEDTPVNRVVPRRKRMKMPEGDTEGEEENVSAELDHVDATIYQMVENNELQLVQPRRGTRNTPRAPSPEIEEEETEPLEKCFLCNKHIPRSQYQQHVNEEIDRQAREESSEGAASSQILTGLD